MIKTVGLEMQWPPNVIGGLFVRGGYNSLQYWYDAVLEKRKRDEVNTVNQLTRLIIGKRK